MAANHGSKSRRRPRAKAGPRAGPGPLRIWGVHACRAAIENPRRAIRSIELTGPEPDWLSDAVQHGAEAGNARPAPAVLDKADFRALLPEQAVHQGIALTMDPMPVPRLDELLSGPARLFVVLDQVEDPHNVGAILRSAAVFGADALIVQSRHSPPESGVLYKAASGACEHVPLVHVPNIARALRAMSDANVTTIGFAEEADSPLHAIEPGGRCAIVMGAEGLGLRRLVRESCDILASLPAFGAISTLNVSNAAAVALYQITIQQRFGNS